ncbi:thaumatin-like protein [Moniliophthora roreri MCA 2997]|uniref:Thaumatin-like protein n=1 Tax=Moniliophthora roreri (strain MCA 2997) TaxID=1381753 RepID=V2YZ81_MONRO|nr:thaumatin-like protein [Moniliophthora roreri MCA 2997]
MKGVFALAPIAVASTVSARTFTVRNNCAYTARPGLFTDPNVGPTRPDQPTGWEAAPEWTLQGDGNLDYYDVSLVDGFNIPMAITNNVNYPVADCPVDLTATCPGELASAAGCASACFANLDGNQQDSANCCSGSHSTPNTCPPDGVQSYDLFKGACLNSYAYAYDESSGTALWTCDSSLNADYTLTFCP